ncbi:hypothetical protein D3C72_2291380 [compost metagenome]
MNKLELLRTFVRVSELSSSAPGSASGRGGTDRTAAAREESMGGEFIDEWGIVRSLLQPLIGQSGA